MSSDHLSVSQLNMYCKCGQQYFYRYEQGLIIPPGSALISGSAVHSARAKYLSKKLSDPASTPPAEMVEVEAANYVEDAFHGEVKLDAEDEGRSIKAVRGQVKDEVVALARLDLAENLTKISPLLVEHWFTVESPLLPKPIVAILDLVDTSSLIIDLKTAKRAPSQADCDKSLQLTTYALALRLAGGQVESGVQLDVLVKSKTPRAMSLRSSRDTSDIQVLLNRLARAHEGITKGIWIPAPVDAWYCDSRWCGYADRCPYFAGKRRLET